MYENIPYQFLDGQTGAEKERPAAVVGELPTPKMRGEALDLVTPVIGERLGLTATTTIKFGAPVYEAFGLTRPQAKRHPESALLLRLGCDVPLSLLLTLPLCSR